MQDSLVINNMYAAYSATSAHVDNKSVTDLSKMLKSRHTAPKEDDTVDIKTMAMDKVIISDEALEMLKKAI